jgi:hypothetical protein
MTEHAKTNLRTVFSGLQKTVPRPQAAIDSRENRRRICKNESSGCPHVTEDAIFSRSPRKFVRKESRELQEPKTEGKP